MSWRRSRAHDARIARGVRRLHDAARPASPDRRRSLRADARERRPAARSTGRRPTTTARTRPASASTARATRQQRRRAVPLRRAPSVERSEDDARASAAVVPPSAVGLPAGVGADAVAGVSWRTTTRGAAQAAQMEKAWAALAGAVDDERHAAVAAKLRQQTIDAAAWRDKCLTTSRSSRSSQRRSPSPLKTCANLHGTPYRPAAGTAYTPTRIRT